MGPQPAPEDHVALLTRMADAVEAATEAGPRATYHEEVRMGADGTPTTVLDALAEEAILRVLDDAGNPYDVLSEEAGHLDHGGDLTLVVDPIDGTRNASRGLPIYCVSLALCGDTMRACEVGVIRNLCTGDTYVATRGGGATFNGAAMPVQAYEPRRPLVAVEWEHTTGARPSARFLEGGMASRQLGTSSMELALVAQGVLDAFVHLSGRLRVIDVAAGALLVREAGGEVVDVGGPERTPLDMPLRLDATAALAAVRGKEAADLLEVIL